LKYLRARSFIINDNWSKSLRRIWIYETFK
jgi:hypothetical protein